MTRHAEELPGPTELPNGEQVFGQTAVSLAISEQSPGRRPLLRAAAVVLAAAACVGALKGELPVGVESVQAAERTKAPRKVELPTLNTEIPPSISEARKILRAAGFKKPGRMVPTKATEKYPSALEGKKYVATGWAKKVIKHIKRGHRTISKVSYDPLKPHTRLPTKSQIYIRAKLVQEKHPAQAGGNPDTAAPQTPTFSTPPAETVPLPVVNTAPTPPTTPPVETPPSSDVPTQISAWQAENTLYAPFLDGCTTTVIRDNTGKAVGASGAAHCNLRTAPRVTGSDGQRYIVTNGPPVFQRGEDVNHLTSFATAKQVILPTADNPSRDLMIMSLEGSTLAQAVSAYKSSVISDTEAIALPAAERQGAITGYPVAFNDYSPSVTRRAATAFSILGLANIFTTAGQTITNTVVTGMKFAPGDPRCSFGDSGGSGEMFAVKRQPNGKDSIVPRTLGVLAGFEDFTLVTPEYNGPAVKLMRERDYGFSFGNNTGACDFDNEIPVAGQGAEVVNLVTDASQIP